MHKCNHHVLPADNEHYDFWPQSGALAQPFECHNFYALHIVYSTSAFKKEKKKKLHQPNYIYIFNCIFFQIFLIFKICPSFKQKQ